MTLKGGISRRDYVTSMAFSFLFRGLVIVALATVLLFADAAARESYTVLLVFVVPILLVAAIWTGLTAVTRRSRTLGWPLLIVVPLYVLYWMSLIGLPLDPLREGVARLEPTGMAVEAAKVVIAIVFTIEVVLAFRSSSRLR